MFSFTIIYQDENKKEKASPVPKFLLVNTKVKSEGKVL